MTDQEPSPKTLVCESCSATGVRIFRPAYSFDVTLNCATCLERAGVKRISDRFEWWVPACPTPHGEFWQYTCVPPADAAEWYSLPESTE